MNDQDYSNLQFLLNANEETLRQWFDVVSDDDKDYAMELLQTAQGEILFFRMQYEEDVTDLTEARNVLSKFTVLRE